MHRSRLPASHGAGRLGLALAAAAILQAATASAATYRVGGGGGCTHATIQAAVNAAATNPGFDTIRITRSLSYTAQAIVVEADTSGVEIVGGYADCLSNVTSLPKSLVSGAGGAAAAVFSLRGVATVFLGNLEISGGDNASGGGGIEIIGGPKTIGLTDLLIRNNQGRYGGGISAIHTADNTSDLQVLIGGETSINNNVSTDTTFQWGGGGIFCENARVLLQGNTYLLQNVSNSQGGGIGADFCAVEIGSAGLLGGVLLNNFAATNGGGISARGRRADVRMYTTVASSPATIINNTAVGSGGGIYLFSNASASIYDGVLSGNIAGRGGAVAVTDDDGSGTQTRFLMQGTTVGAPSGALNCAQRERCNRISDNRAQNTSGTPQPGAAIHVRAGNDFSAVATLRSTRLNGNVGQSLLDMELDGDASFDGVLIEGNSASAALLDAGDGFSQNLVIAASTIAGNTIGVGQPIIRARNQCAINGNTYLGTQVYRSILWQPGHALLSMSGTPNLDCFQYLLANDLTPLPASTLNRTGDPLFADAPGGNFRLHLASPALDYAVTQAANSTRDLGPRIVDDPTVTNEFGPHDLGAYEIDSIFAYGFE
jgi:predicted outer membrane repeat protein